MNPRAVVFEITGKLYGYVCEKCGGVSGVEVFEGESNAKRSATDCCNRACADCGAPSQPGWVVCMACRTLREKKRDRERFDAAQKIPLAEYAGEFVYIEGAHNNDGFVTTEDVHDALIEMQRAGEEIPEWAWATVAEKAHYVLEDALAEHIEQEHHEDAGDWVDWKIVTAAQKLVDEAIKDVATYREDNAYAVLLPSAAAISRLASEAGEEDEPPEADTSP